MGTWITENKRAIAFTLIVLVAGTAGYFALGIREGMAADNGTAAMPAGTVPAGAPGAMTAPGNQTMPGTGPSGGNDTGTVLPGVDPSVFTGTRYKAAYAPDGSLKIFAHAKNNALATLRAAEGKRIPEDDSMTIGYTKAEMMKRENLFAKPGDSLTGFFGIPEISIEGLIEKTGTPVDMMHFLGSQNFANITGEEGRIYSRVTPAGVPKMFYYLAVNGAAPPKFVLAEGNMSGYTVRDLGGVKFYPLVIGSDEAAMMREEKLFVAPGDEIRGFFGRDVVVVGVLEKTNTGLDMMHFIPVNESHMG